MLRRRLFLVVLGVLALSASVLAQPPPPYRVVVNPKNPTASVDRKFVEDAFLKKVSSWPDGETIKPVNLAVGSPTRRAFTTEVLGRSVEEVRRYWQQRIFSGRDVPPLEVASDDDVIKYVLQHEGGIGYVSPSANLGSARILVVR